MNIVEAQKDMRRAYVGGGPGALVSGLVWLSAGFVERARGVTAAFDVLFLGGMVIFPLSTLICRSVFRRNRAALGNSLGLTALESTVAMIGGLFAAWLFLTTKPDLVFPLSAIAVGTHYAVFRSVYGDALYVVLAALLTGIGVGSIFLHVSSGGGVTFVVAGAELVMGGLLTVRALRARETH